jgi:hypothetical protein
VSATCRRKAAAYKELLQREERRDKLGGVLQRMNMEKAVMVRLSAAQCLYKASLLTACSSSHSQLNCRRDAGGCCLYRGKGGRGSSRERRGSFLRTNGSRRGSDE